MRRAPLKELYYITHINNLPSILKRGILSHELVEAQKVEFTRIYDDEIVAKRRDRKTPDGRSLWSFANIYFQARNPMLYRVVCEKSPDEIVILGVQMSILNKPDIFISTGNAAHSLSDILVASEGRKVLSQIEKNTAKEYWTDESGSKRKIMAECLVPGVIPPQLITGVYVASHEAVDKVRLIVQQFIFPWCANPICFSNPIAKNISRRIFMLLKGICFSLGGKRLQ